MTHHFQRDLDVVYEVILLPNKQRMSFLPHNENNISRDAVWSLKTKYSKINEGLSL